MGRRSCRGWLPNSATPLLRNSDSRKPPWCGCWTAGKRCRPTCCCARWTSCWMSFSTSLPASRGRGRSTALSPEARSRRQRRAVTAPGLCGGRLGGEGRHNLGAGAGLALRPDAPAMGFDDAAADVQAEAEPTTAIFAPCLREPLEDRIEGALGYAGTGIDDGQPDVGSVALTANDDLAALGGEPERIGDEIGEHLEDAVVVERRQQRRRRNPGEHGDSLGAGGCLEGILRFGDEACQVAQRRG